MNKEKTPKPTSDNEVGVEKLVRLPNRSYCNVCEIDNRRNALQVNGVKICVECAKFLGNWAEIYRQANYIKYHRAAYKNRRIILNKSKKITDVKSGKEEL
ncbi:MAG: hypothetical protein PVH88_02060 [Ignavibacteria bacterium]|jgi:hypothetical protein